LILSQDQTLVKNLFSSNIIYYWSFCSVSIMTLSSFDASFIARVLTLKGLETDTLYLVFKHRLQIVFGLRHRRLKLAPSKREY
jgi:hypothetical protein